jgi:DNA modification methylase
LFVEHIVEVFREVRRVLRPDGTLWLNIGDSYCAQGGPGAGGNVARMGRAYQQRNIRPNGNYEGLKPKDLVGIPWMVAFALRADGWWLRQDIIWAKPNPMPESVQDRCTKAHEYLFLLSKSERYYMDMGAIREPGAEPDRKRADRIGGTNGETVRHSPGSIIGASAYRNKRSVWTIPTAPFSLAHFATFPPALVEPCILAGSREGDIVLDPFIGSGTTAMVAKKLGRRAIGIDMKSEYMEMAMKRLGPQMSMAVAP